MNTYVPDELPLKDLNYQKLLSLVGRANAELARYDGLLQGIPNPAVMLPPFFSKPTFRSSDLTKQLKDQHGIHR